MESVTIRMNNTIKGLCFLGAIAASSAGIYRCSMGKQLTGIVTGSNYRGFMTYFVETEKGKEIEIGPVDYTKKYHSGKGLPYLNRGDSVKIQLFIGQEPESFSEFGSMSGSTAEIPYFVVGPKRLSILGDQRSRSLEEITGTQDSSSDSDNYRSGSISTPNLGIRDKIRKTRHVKQILGEGLRRRFPN